MISGLVGDELIRKINQRAKWFEVGLILGRPLLFSAPKKRTPHPKNQGRGEIYTAGEIIIVNVYNQNYNLII
jgi:hypothetical protein